MYQIYIIKKTNNCETRTKLSEDCCNNCPECECTPCIPCPVNLYATMDLAKACAIRDILIEKCTTDCTENECFTYCIETMPIIGKYEDIC